MNPQSNEAMPPAVPGGEAPSASSAEISPQSEKAAIAERAAQLAPPPSSLPTFQLPVDNQQKTNKGDDQQRPASSISTQDNPSHAQDDRDLLEKEWISRTKQIISRTKDDPYKQSEELTVLKADYMKKRYNKTIKIDK